MTHRWRVPLLVGAGLLLLQVGWILSLAPYWGIDEFDHAYRASSVAAGHWQPGDDPITGSRGRGDLIPVRADVAANAHGACDGRPYTGELNCRPLTGLGGDEVLIASAAARYNPTYYAAVGTVARPFHGAAYLYALRLASAALCALLLVLTLRVALAGAATQWPLLATLTALLPTTVYSTAVAAPNGVEMIAGLGTWVALQVVAGGPVGAQRRAPAYGLLALNAAVLAETHTLGPVWLALILAVTAVRYGPVRVIKALWPRRRTEAVLALATAAAVAFQVVWVAASGVNNPTLEKSAFTGDPWTFVAQGLVLWPLQAIGAFPMRNDRAPLAVYAMVLLVLVLLVGGALRRVRLRSRQGAAMLLVGILSFAVPSYLTVRTFHQLGAAWQGRYASPFAVGLLVLAGLALDRRGRFSARARSGAAAAAGVLVLAQLLGQWSMLDGQTRVPAVVAATHWSPPSPAVLVLLALGAAACWCAAAYWFRPATAAEVATADRDGERDIVLA